MLNLLVIKKKGHQKKSFLQTFFINIKVLQEKYWFSQMFLNTFIYQLNFFLNNILKLSYNKMSYKNFFQHFLKLLFQQKKHFILKTKLY